MGAFWDQEEDSGFAVYSYRSGSRTALLLPILSASHPLLSASPLASSCLSSLLTSPALLSSSDLSPSLWVYTPHGVS